MNWKDHIISDNEILLGKPTIKGTRISVELILDLLSNGWTEKMIFESYPTPFPIFNSFWLFQRVFIPLQPIL
jgi:uncharacterized protein (DUF433 family)